MKSKRYLKLSLLLLMLTGLLFCFSTSASAATVAKIGSKSYSSLEKAINEVKSNQTIKIQKNFTLRKRISVKKNIKFTINLQKHVITLKDSVPGEALSWGGIIIAKGNVTITNGTLKGNSKYGITVISVSKGAKATLSNCKIAGSIDNSGKLTIKSGTYRFKNEEIFNSGELIINNGTFIGEGTCSRILYNAYKCTIKKGTFINKYQYGSLIWNGTNVAVKKKATLVIKGGTYSVAGDRHGIEVGNGGTINLTGGMVKTVLDIEEGGAVVMSGGSIKNQVINSGKFTMKGGTLSTEGFTDYHATALRVVQNGTAQLTKGTIIGGYSGERSIDYSVIYTRKRANVSLGSGITIINRGDRPDIFAEDER